MKAVEDFSGIFKQSSRKIEIFDTSLRDGAQTPGVNLTAEDKIKIAVKLDKIGVDYIEGGFAAASKADFKALKQIVKQTQNSIVVSLARLKEGDINIAYEALKQNIQKAMVHTFIGTSPLHRQYKLKKSKEQILADIEKYVSYAVSKFDQVMFSPEDALRTEEEFLFEAVTQAIKAGANVINIPDTVGFAQPLEILILFQKLKNEFGKDVKFSAHTHNDLGNAVTNTLHALLGGGDMVQDTFPPLFGERAGNADLIQVVMNIKKRPDYYPFSVEHIAAEKFGPLTMLIQNISGKRIPPHYPIMGRLVYAHSSGIHQHGVSANKQTYEIIDPKEVGIKIEQSFILTNQTGSEGLRQAIKQYFGIELSKEDIKPIFAQFKEIASKQKFLTMEDIRFILQANDYQVDKIITLKWGEIILSYPNDGHVKASMVFKDRVGNEKLVIGKGVGPVDAVFNAFGQYIKAIKPDINMRLVNFEISALGGNSSANAQVYIQMEIDGEICEEYGIAPDIVKASINALEALVNRVVGKVN